MKNSLEGLNGRFEQATKRMNKLEGKTTEMISSLRVAWNSIKYTNITL